jgi:hypothetical protein
MEARTALTSGRGRQGIGFIRSLRKRGIPALKRGRVLLALELFWSSYNPHMTRVAIRPFFRFMGGNDRPFIATFTTFVFSGLVVHLMGLTATCLGLCWWLGQSSPSAGWARAIASDFALWVQSGIILTYVATGLLVGIAKSLRQGRSGRSASAGG